MQPPAASSSGFRFASDCVVTPPMASGLFGQGDHFAAMPHAMSALASLAPYEGLE